jgi:NAD(P)-dependent dehydrogenase (short-subunit alcohol dehydrogenase family)
VTSLFDLTGKVALITGSTKGIGLAIARRMAEHGARVVISSRKAERCQEVAAALRAEGREAFAKPCNVGVAGDVKALVDAVLAHWQRIDILVCNAGINPHYGPALELTDAAFDNVINANVRSVHQLCNLVLPQMAEHGEGAVIAISSIAGLYGTDKLGIYAVSKAAELQLMRNVAVEWGPRGIRANSIAPSIIRTDFAKTLWSNPALLKLRNATTPLGRIAEADEIAGIAVFLASRAARYVTGQTIVADGGRSISSAVPASSGDAT